MPLDTRTNAGVDHISTFKKMYTFGVDGERSIIMLTAGNLATSQAVANLLRSGIAQGSAQNLLNLPSLFECAMLVGEQASSVAKTSQHRAHMQEGFGSNFLLGGQIKGQPQELYQIYQEGNCISATEDTRFPNRREQIRQADTRPLHQPRKQPRRRRARLIGVV